jgi:hypothetical protein
MTDPACTIHVNEHSYDVAEHYRKLGFAKLPATPTLTVTELAYAGGAANYQPCYRKDGSRVTTSNFAFCLCEGEYEVGSTVWTTQDHALRAIPLHDGQRFTLFPEGFY